METKHTPGPWSFIEHNWSDTTIYGPNKERICRISIADEATEDNQQDLERIAYANARLIAAAPELLDLVIHALKEQMDLRPQYRDQWFVASAEDAIARATLNREEGV